jgi:hypothetical protein
MLDPRSNLRPPEAELPTTTDPLLPLSEGYTGTEPPPLLPPEG